MPNGVLHVELQRPAPHESDATFVDAQARPQAPQFAGSALVSFSQPSSLTAASG
ncbi:MAG: hypothetical protein HYY84_08875 [Deltaproteobacteria bacterium]|nr:hypothetical protein [Deltaproteobacteria bacterium]